MFSWMKDAADGGFQVICESGISERMFRGAMVSQVPQFRFLNGDVHKATPVVIHRQHGSDANQSGVAGRQVQACTA